MRINREEIFGPAVAVIRVSDADEAVRIANDTPFGLAAAVWTGRRTRAPHRRRAACRHRLGEHVRRPRSLRRVWWARPVRLRLRAGTADDRRVHDLQDRPARAVNLYELDRAHVIHPHAVVGRPEDPIVWARGDGARLWDVEGNEYVDGTCGLWQCAVGHGRAELAEAAAVQMRRLEFYASFWDFSN